MCFEASGCALLLVTPNPPAPCPPPKSATHSRPAGATRPFLLPEEQLGACHSVSQLGMLRASPPPRALVGALCSERTWWLRERS